ncbi:hypothetical protein PR048_017813 [Dryococelus australis]|uniref:Nucleolar protein 9 n=1 Tax=Dryococelus australis TaxID=614101 RepID=A0ABQ9HAN2_9NEOP|nr:hypothetical protein PR048_017813 [Dryococelus australis]
MSELESRIRNRGKKRKRSFVSQAKKFGKVGKFGKGSRLDDEKYQYFLRVWEMNKDENFQTDDERVFKALNGVEHFEGQEEKFQKEQDQARVIEIFILLVNCQAIDRCCSMFGEDLRPIFCDQFASHVLQKLIAIAAKSAPSVTEESSSEDESHVNFSDWLLKVGRYALNNLEEFVWDTYANQVVRTVLECLAGLPLRSTHNSKEVPSSVTVEETHKELLMDFGNRVMSWSHLPDIVFTDLTSAFLQTLLQALRVKHKKLTHSLVRKLLNECLALPKSTEDVKEIKHDKDCASDASQLLPVFSSAPASRVLDVAIMVASSKLRTQIYVQCFINKMLQLSTLPVSNFCVQKLLSYHKVKEEFEAMYDELGPHLDKLLASNNTGVLLSLGQACLRLTAKQGSFMQHLIEALDCKTEQEFVPLVLQLTSTKKLDDSLSIHIHGSVLVQTMLRFNKPIKVHNCLMNHSGRLLLTMMSDSGRSRIVGKFMMGQFLYQCARERRLGKIKISAVEVVNNSEASRSLDAADFCSPMFHKEMMLHCLLTPALRIKNSTANGSENYYYSLFLQTCKIWSNSCNKLYCKCL